MFWRCPVLVERDISLRAVWTRLRIRRLCFMPSPASGPSAHANAAIYKDMYGFSISDPDSVWEYHGKRIDWIKPFARVKNTCFDSGKISIKWFEDGTTNVASNCIDRHLAKRAEQVAIIWEGDDPKESKKITYRELHEHVRRFANVLWKSNTSLNTTRIWSRENGSR